MKNQGKKSLIAILAFLSMIFPFASGSWASLGSKFSVDQQRRAFDEMEQKLAREQHSGLVGGISIAEQEDKVVAEAGKIFEGNSALTETTVKSNNIPFKVKKLPDGNFEISVEGIGQIGAGGVQLIHPNHVAALALQAAADENLKTWNEVKLGFQQMVHKDKIRAAVLVLGDPSIASALPSDVRDGIIKEAMNGALALQELGQLTDDAWKNFNQMVIAAGGAENVPGAQKLVGGVMAQGVDGTTNTPATRATELGAKLTAALRNTDPTQRKNQVETVLSDAEKSLDDPMMVKVLNNTVPALLQTVASNLTVDLVQVSYADLMRSPQVAIFANGALIAQKALLVTDAEAGTTPASIQSFLKLDNEPIGSIYINGVGDKRFGEVLAMVDAQNAEKIKQLAGSTAVAPIGNVGDNGMISFKQVLEIIRHNV